MTRPPRVLHVVQPTTSGVGAYVADACADQQRRGWHVAVACPDEGDLARRLAELRIVRFRWAAERVPGPRTLAEARRLHRLVGAFRPDVVHLHSSKAGLAGRLLPSTARGHRPVVVFQPHGWSWPAAGGGLGWLALWWERAAARRTDLLVCVGAGEAQVGIAGRVPGLLRIVRNGVDLTRFRPAGAEEKAQARARLGIDPDARLAVCVGRVTRQKGQDVLLKAWPLVRAGCPRAELAVVGSGDRLARARRQAGAGVRFTYEVDDPRPWYAASDVVVVPSRWEGLPFTALEAMATGRPVVASDIPGLSELVAPGAGALVPPGDVGALSEALVERLSDAGTAEREGLAAAGLALGCAADRTFAELAAVVTEAVQDVRGVSAPIGVPVAAVPPGGDLRRPSGEPRAHRVPGGRPFAAPRR
ncbi:Glycosyltransferase involved in cell wall bisynthesis [Thermomonospora echinospora]|uniref:Glycosyltransferase involved in cell wall bisynthesis n=1 Tax=Thermomonospora echinospora TaxID=1992 RepID=A0A1H6C9H5_9ACTN|nr:glycosyltransferase [Thermomonospora echinospora]SEG69558.1 Glycosyltransferase involved in cell wall bisynthesis [Thermomonospora echinospora]